MVVWLLVGAVVPPPAAAQPRGPRRRGRPGPSGALDPHSYRWAPPGERAHADTQRLALYLGGWWPAYRCCANGWPAGWNLGWHWAPWRSRATDWARLLPGLVELPQPAAVGRLEQPLTYWNAKGCLAAIAFVLCTRLAADPRPRAVRAGAGAASPVVAAGVYLSLSRGALLALAVGS